MKPSNRFIVLGVAFGLLVVLWAISIGPSPPVPKELDWETQGLQGDQGMQPQTQVQTDGKPFLHPSEDHHGSLVKAKEVKRKAIDNVPEASPHPHSLEEKTILQLAVEKSQKVDEKLVNGTLPPLPIHVTGQWSDELHQTQKKLVMQISGLTTEWVTQLRQTDASPPSPTDLVIQQQLRNRHCCNKLLRKVTWTREDLLKDLKIFINDVYPNRPIHFNQGGMRVSHAFGCWFIVKALQPKYILESGVHLGQSTWLLRQAAPDAKIISMDPRTDMSYWDKGTTYYTGNGASKEGYDVRPFKDFSEIDWSFIKDKDEALILWDDHQNEYKRTLLARKLGFRHMIFDDNWSPLQGDNYSMKQVCDETGGMALRPPNFPSTKVLMTDQFHMADKFITIEEHKANHAQLLSILEVYYETPPVLFVPPHMRYHPFGHKPDTDTTPVNYVMPPPSVRLLKWMAESIIAPPLVQSQAEFDEIGVANVTHDDLWFYVSLAYARFTPHRDSPGLN